LVDEFGEDPLDFSALGLCGREQCDTQVPLVAVRPDPGDCLQFWHELDVSGGLQIVDPWSVLLEALTYKVVYGRIYRK
jgi:hypothetical protein